MNNSKSYYDIYNGIVLEKAPNNKKHMRMVYSDDTYKWISEPFEVAEMYNSNGKTTNYFQFKVDSFISDIVNDRHRKTIDIENVYVYNDKVVIVKFSDGSKVKSIFDGDGEFSVYNGVAICIAKKLIGNDGTKVFNDSMRAAMKIYRDKESKKVPKKDACLREVPRKYHEGFYNNFEARCITKLRKCKNMSCSDISDLLDIPESAVRSYLEGKKDE